MRARGVARPHVIDIENHPMLMGGHWPSRNPNIIGMSIFESRNRVNRVSRLKKDSLSQHTLVFCLLLVRI